MVGIRFLATVLLAALLSLGMLGVSRSETVTYLGLTFPEKIAGATRGPATEFARDAGYGILYYLRDWDIDVRVGFDGEPPIPEDPTSAVLTSHLEEIKRKIARRQDGVGTTRIEFVRDYVVNDRAGRARLRCADVVYSFQGGRARDQFLCIAGWRDKFVEFELYGPHQSGSDATARRFVEAWLPILWP